MVKLRLILGLTLTGALLLSACASAAQSAQVDVIPDQVGPGTAAMENEAVDGMDEGGMDSAGSPDTETGMQGQSENQGESLEGSEKTISQGDSNPQDIVPSENMADLPVYFSLKLTDPTSGQEFTIQDHKGKVILVETMAMWCTTCLRQQGEVKKLHEQLGERDDFVSLGLDIDPNENAADLSAYLARNDFDWMYAVAPVEVAREIGELYGSQFLNPSSAPMYIIDRAGDVHLLPFGVKSAADLFAALAPFLNEGM